MAYSWQEQRLPAGSQTVPVEIQYLDRSYIHLYINGVEVTDFTWNSDTRIRFDQTLVEESTVLLVRRTTREYLYLMFSEGAAFIKENLDTQNLQFLHLAQELVEGRAIDGFFGEINMNGYKITNLAPGTAPGDAVNKGQLDGVDTRVTQLEQNWLVPSSSYPWFTNTTEETDVLTPGFTFTKAAVYINGVCQTPGYSYEVVDNTIMLADTVPAGTHIMARLGEDVPNDQGYATAAQLANTNLRVDTVESELSMLSSEVDQDLAALQALTAVVDGKADKGDAGLGQLGGGGTGIAVFKSTTGPLARTALGMSTVGNALAIAADAAAGRTALGLGNLSTRNQGIAVADLSVGADLSTTVTKVNALLASLRAAGIITT